MFVSILLGLSERSAPKRPERVGRYLWRAPDLPSREAFGEMVERVYDLVQPPAEVAHVWVEVESSDGIATFSDPVRGAARGRLEPLERIEASVGSW